MIDVVSSFLFSIILHKSRTPLSRKPVVILHSVSKSSRHFFFFSCKIFDNCLKKGFFFHEQNKCCALFSNLLDVNVWFFIIMHRSHTPLSRKALVTLHSLSSLQDFDLFPIYALYSSLHHHFHVIKDMWNCPNSRWPKPFRCYPMAQRHLCLPANCLITVW